MGIFSRRSAADDDAAATRASETTDARDAAPAEASTGGAGPEASVPAENETVPQVGISVSTFRGSGSGSPAATKAPSSVQPAQPAGGHARTGEPPAITESIPGLRDNALLVQALKALPATPDGTALLGVVRQLLQSHIFLRVQGDARALIADGKPLPMQTGRRGEQQFVLVYSSGAALRDALKADGDQNTTAVAQPVSTILQHVLQGTYDGLIVDPASPPARAVLPRAVLETAFSQADPDMRVKTLLTQPRTPETASTIGAALAETRMWVAVREVDQPGGDGTAWGVAEARTSEGERFLEVFSHPLEIVAMGRSDKAIPFEPAQLGAALRAEPKLTGVIVDGAGPWLRIRRDDLGAVLALPAPEAPLTTPKDEAGASEGGAGDTAGPAAGA